MNSDLTWHVLSAMTSPTVYAINILFARLLPAGFQVDCLGMSVQLNLVLVLVSRQLEESCCGTIFGDRLRKLSGQDRSRRDMSGHIDINLRACIALSGHLVYICRDRSGQSSKIQASSG